MLIMGYVDGMPSAPKKDKEAGPAFKPRKVKKSTEKYRNRAEERRVGADHDYSQVRSVLCSCIVYCRSTVHFHFKITVDVTAALSVVYVVRVYSLRLTLA